MGDSKDICKKSSGYNEGQCQYFVVRKKRLCRMTVRPGRSFCGEHEPHPPPEAAQADNRIPCPYDPKHTCYASKLEKHLKICNARPEELPPYIVQDINAPVDAECLFRKPLTEIPKETVLKVINKINKLYGDHVEGNISVIPEQDIHDVVRPEFEQALRTESSRRHLRQASALLRLVEAERLVWDQTCYVELGAGKGQLSYFASLAWCSEPTSSGVLLVDRSALRHKRDGRLPPRHLRLRADLRHLALARLDELRSYKGLVGIAKHLCGAATDYALRCLTSAGAVECTRGLVMATCCHHRCDRDSYTGKQYLQDLGVTGEELNIIFSIVSWATCGDGRARDYRSRDHDTASETSDRTCIQSSDKESCLKDFTKETSGPKDHKIDLSGLKDSIEELSKETAEAISGGMVDKDEGKSWLCLSEREEVGRRAKAVLEWGRALFLRGRGLQARLCYYVPASVSLENLAIIASRPVP